MLEETRPQGQQACVTTYSSTISAGEKVLQWKRALVFLEGIRSLGQQANLITFTSTTVRDQLQRSCQRVCEVTTFGAGPGSLQEKQCFWLAPIVISYSASISACEKGLHCDQDFNL